MVEETIIPLEGTRMLDEEQVERLAENVGTYYTTLIESGVPKALAAELTRDWHSQFLMDKQHWALLIAPSIDAIADEVVKRMQ